MFPTALLWYLLTLEREFTSGKSRHVRQTTTIAVRKVIKASGRRAWVGASGYHRFVPESWQPGGTISWCTHSTLSFTRLGLVTTLFHKNFRKQRDGCNKCLWPRTSCQRAQWPDCKEDRLFFRQSIMKLKYTGKFTVTVLQRYAIQRNLSRAHVQQTARVQQAKHHALVIPAVLRALYTCTMVPVCC